MTATRIWAVLPAAGIGRRMGATLPKQYLPLLDRTILSWSLDALLGHPRVTGGVIALAEHDPLWDELGYQPVKPLHRAVGGSERMHSVHAALTRLLELGAGDDDWALVHDAVRPCLTQGELTRLIQTGLTSPDGALLAMPVRDTLKRAGGDGCVAATAEREGLWHALTPQLFPVRRLHQALEAAIAAGEMVTDEAQAMERAGARPLLVEGAATNLKITRGADLALAAAILRAQRQTETIS